MPVKNPKYLKSLSEGRGMGKDKSQHASHQPSQHVADDIVFGSVDIETIRENVGRFNIKEKASKSKNAAMDSEEGVEYGVTGSRRGSCDQSSVMSSSTSSLSSANANTPSVTMPTNSLPDVVQQYSEQPQNVQSTQNQEPNEVIGSNLLEFGTKNKHCSPSQFTFLTSDGVNSFNNKIIQQQPYDTQPKIGEPMLSNTMIDSTNSLSSRTSSSSPITSVSSSLAHLQDPATFTMGSPEKKNRITKANFGQEEGALLNRSSNTGNKEGSDPLASLDPLWSIGK